MGAMAFTSEARIGERAPRSARCWLTLGLIVGAGVGAVQANPLSDGFAALQADDDRTALRIWLPLARSGDLMAEVYLGALFLSGSAPDYAQAIVWTRKAAERGNAAAQHNLGFIYERGVGVRRDPSTAINWYRRSAKQGHARAQWRLAALFRAGDGAPRDFDLAASWMRKAAEQGEPQAQEELGDMYRLGQGVPQDYALALEWYRKAADLGHLGALNDLGMMYRLGAGTAPDIAKARELFSRAAARGLAAAQYNLGSMDFMGQGAAPDFTRSYMWFTLAAAKAADEATRREARRNLALLTEKMSSAQIEEATRLARDWREATGPR